MQSIKERILQIPRLSNSPGIKELANIIESELKHLSAETLIQNQHSVLEITQKLVPECFGRPNPVYGLACVNVNNIYTIKINNKIKLKRDKKTYSFSPVFDVKCYPVQVKFLCAAGKWWDTKLNGLVTPKTLSNPIKGHFSIGLQIEEEIKSLDGLQIFFQGLPEKSKMNLQFSKVIYKGKQLKLIPAHLPKMEEYLKTHICDREFLHIHNLRKQIAQITSEIGLFRLEELSQDNPFFEPDLDIISSSLKDHEKGKIDWLHLILPESIPDEQMINCNVEVNTFPIWNVFNAQQRAKTSNEKELIIPLDKNQQNTTNDIPSTLIAIDRIWTHSENPYAPRELFPGEAGTYKLENRNPRILGSIDLANYIDTLTWKLDQIDPKGLAAFSKESEDVLQPFHEKILEFSKLWTEMRTRLASMAQKEYYLKIYPSENGAVVFVDYWKTNPEAKEVIWPDNLSIDFGIPDVSEAIMLFICRENDAEVKNENYPWTLLKNRLFQLDEKL